MQTRLSLFCDRLIEAGWLAAAAVIPAFFNIYTARIFEPDKLSVLRSIAVIMLAAWGIKTIETWRAATDPFREVRRFLTASPLHPAALFLIAVYVVTTITSVAPETSLWGSFERLQGVVSYLSYLVIFFLVAANLRTREQLNRVVLTIIFVSVPICLYGILQHFGADPIPWGSDVRGRVTSTMGNAIFLAAYLIMVVPLVLVRLIGAIRAYWVAWHGPRPRQTPWLPLVGPGLAIAGYAILLVLQLVAIVWTQSRGPWLGLGAGLAVAAVLLTLLQRRRAVTFGMIGAVVATIALVLLINIPRGPLSSLRDRSPYLERLGSILNVNDGTNKVRLLIWFGDNIGTGSWGMIRANPWRTLVGYGPESMFVAYTPFYPPELAQIEDRNRTPDRSHNEYLDAMTNSGVLGLVAFLAVIGVGLWQGIRFIRRTRDLPLRLLAIAIVGALVAHYLEVFVGIGIAATRTMLWLYLGMLMAMIPLATRPATSPEPAPEPARASNGPARPERRLRRTGRVQVSGTRGAAALAWEQAAIPFSDLRTYPLLFFLVFSFLAAPGMPIAKGMQALINYPPALIFGGFLWLLVGIVTLTFWLPQPRTSIQWLPSRLWAYTIILFLTVFLVFQFMSVVVADVYSRLGQAYERQQQQLNTVPFYAKSVMWAPDTDIYLRFLGGTYLQLAQVAKPKPSTQAIADMDTLLQLQPAAIADMGQEDLFHATEIAMQQAYRVNPLSRDNSVNLGRLYLAWGRTMQTDDTRNEKYQQALQSYERAISLSPNTAQLYNELGVAYYTQGKHEEALAEYRKSLELDAKYAATYLYMADTLLAKNDMDGAAEAYQRALDVDPNSFNAYSGRGVILYRQGKLQEAIASQEKAAEISPKDLVTRRNLAIMYSEAGRVTEALSSARLALDLSPPQDKPTMEQFVADLQRRAG